MNKIYESTYPGKVSIGSLLLDCAVLEGGIRVLSQRAVTKALGGKRGGSHWKRIKENPDGANLPIYLSARNLADFIDDSLMNILSTPYNYRISGMSGAIAIGLSAEALPLVCEVYLKARDSGALHYSQIHIANQADVLMRGLAHVGIVALIDEATGYQEVRERKALAAILDAYLRKELAAWAKRFPDEFYKEIFRLRGWAYNPSSVKRPVIVAKYTNDLVYQRIAPGLLEELQKRNPKDDKGRRRNKHFQWMTEDIGDPALAQHIHALVVLMRASKSWEAFYESTNMALPKKNDVHHALLPGVAW